MVGISHYTALSAGMYIQTQSKRNMKQSTKFRTEFSDILSTISVKQIS